MSREFNFKKRLLTTILIDFLVFAACLLTFAYFHHVRVRNITPTAISTRPAASAPMQAAPAEPTQAAPSDASTSPSGETASDGGEASAQAANADGLDTSGMFGPQFADKFARGETERTDSTYRSKNVSIEVVKKEYNTSTYYVADIYVRDISCFRTAVALDYKDQIAEGRKNVMQVLQFSELTGAVLALSGDNFVYRNAGVLAIRNGLEWANKSPYTDDVCVLFYDGTMETFSSKSAAAWRTYVEDAYARGPYQCWSFGPSLLDENGGARTSFSNTVSPENPRSAIGYYEPGHYCFVLVDGRQAGYSIGLTLAELSQVFADLGCKLAYNLDGGDTVAMTFSGALVNHPEEAVPRAVSDVLLIGEPVDLSATAGGQTE